MVSASSPVLSPVFYLPQWPHVFLADPPQPEEPDAALLAVEEREAGPGALCIPLRQACRVVWQMTAELLAFTADRTARRRDVRRRQCHVRQIAMYVCHVALRLPQADVAFAFGRDRTTVRHACSMVEDRRDHRGYDAFVAAVERLAVLVFQPAEGAFDD